MGSFKLKLVGYFLLLSLLPLAAAFWGFSAVAAKSETRRVDARLQAGLRAALVAYDERLDAAQQSATALARYRTIAAGSLGDAQGGRLAALAPQSLIDAANHSSRNRLLLGLLASLLLVAGVAYVEGRSIVRTLRGLVSAAHSIAQGRLEERV